MTKGVKCDYCSYFVTFIREYFNKKRLFIVDERKLEENKFPQFNRHGSIINKQPNSISEKSETKPEKRSETKSKIPRLISLKKREKSNKVVIEYKNGEYLIAEKLFKDHEFNEKKIV